MKLARTAKLYQTDVMKSGRRVRQTVPIFTIRPKEPERTIEQRFRDQKPEVAEARKKAALEKRLRKQRERRGDL